MKPPSVDPYYYLHNFKSALTWLGQRYDDILIEDERRFLAEFQQIPTASQALLVRMLMRKGDFFRGKRLIYDEIGDINQAAAALLNAGWLLEDPVLTLDELFALCTQAELRCIFPAIVSQAATKSRQLEILLADAMPARPYSAWYERGADRVAPDRVAPDRVAPDRVAPDRVFQVTIAPLCERLRLMYFGNLRQTWAEFILVDLGVFKYETVSFDPTSRGFTQRADVDFYLHLLECRQKLAEPCPASTLPALVAAVAAVGPGQAWLEARRGKLLFQIAYRAEREQDWDTALLAYAASTYAGSRYRAIRTLERCARFEAALDAATSAAQAPESDAERQGLQRIIPRLRRRLGHPAQPAIRRVSNRIEHIELSLPRNGSISVEQAVQCHLAQTGASVHYVENALINSLFGLLCWDAIFAALPGAFFHPFQHGPADLHAPDFRSRRAEIFTRCLAQLDGAQYRHTILQNFRSKMEIQSPFVFWGVLSEELLQLALHCIPAPHLKRWFDRMLEDLKTNRSGLPDLICFWPHECRYELVEVKGPGDRLQDNQVRWLEYCVDQGMPVKVIHVRWTADSTPHGDARPPSDKRVWTT